MKSYNVQIEFTFQCVSINTTNEVLSSFPVYSGESYFNTTLVIIKLISKNINQSNEGISIQLLLLLNLRISVILDFDYTPFFLKIQPFLYFLPTSFCFLVFFEEWRF